MDTTTQPLAGITVIEHGEHVAAQYCGRMLAVLGARVIKVEPPGGCALRCEPPLLDDDSPRSALFEYLNIGKLSVTCDLGQASGRLDFEKLLGIADLLLDDTAVTKRVGVLDAQRVRQAYPKMLFVSILPFGATGEHRDYVGTELNLLHAGGEGYLMPNGLALEIFPDRPPVKIYGHFAELVGGLSALCATLAAILAQPETGGQFVDVSVQDANIALSCFALQRLGDGVLETRHTRSFRYGGVLECVDGSVQLLVLEQHQWLNLVELMGRPAWALTPEFENPLERGRRGREINEHLREWAKTQSTADVVERGQALGVPLTPYKTTKAVLEGDLGSERPIFATTSLAGLGDFPVFVAPFRSSDQLAPLGKGIGQPGSDNSILLSINQSATPT